MSEHVVSKGIPGSTLKIIAIITMLIDHIAAVVLADYLSIDGIRTIYKIMRSIGRLGFPIFCFLLVEGFMHTRDIKRYARNLGLFALISEVPFDLAFKHKLIYLDYQNVFFTLFLSLLAIWIISLIEENEQWNKVHQLLSVIAAAVSGLLLVYGFLNHYYALHTTLQIDRVTLEMIRSSYQMLFYIGGVVMALVIYLVLLRIRGREFLIRNSLILSCMLIFALAADLLKTDYSCIGVVTITVMYLLRYTKMTEAAAGCTILTLMHSNEISSLAILLPIQYYNGLRGLRLKYVFYCFYPAHLLILYLIGRLLKMI